MHIKIERISLNKLNFEIKTFESKELAINLNIDVESEFPDENRLVQRVKFDLFHNVENSPIDLSFTFIGHYSAEGEGTPTLEEFSRIHAPAYVVPYARELIANITSRTGVLATLVMPPINIFELLKASSEASKQPEI